MIGATNGATTSAAQQRWPLVFAGLSGALAVLSAAGTAHDLKESMAAPDLERIHTAVRYQIWHALALLGVAALNMRGPSTPLRIAAYSFALGSVLFCGGLYLLSFTGLVYFGWLTPIGGLSFMAGWLALAWHGWRFRSS